MCCSQHRLYGAAILTYSDPDSHGNTITLIVAIFEKSVTCEVKEDKGETGVGKLLLLTFTSYFLFSSCLQVLITLLFVELKGNYFNFHFMLKRTVFTHKKRKLLGRVEFIFIF